MAQGQIIPIKQMAAMLNRDPKTIWRWWAKEKIFPEPIRINGRCIGWTECAYQQWLNNQMGGVQ